MADKLRSWAEIKAGWEQDAELESRPEKPKAEIPKKEWKNKVDPELESEKLKAILERADQDKPSSRENS